MTMNLQATVHMRALWAERMAHSTGTITREQIKQAFDVSLASASAALAYLQHHNPRALTFDDTAHRYRWNEGMRPTLTPPHWFMEIAVRVMTTLEFQNKKACAVSVAGPDCEECGFNPHATWCSQFKTSQNFVQSAIEASTPRRVRQPLNITGGVKHAKGCRALVRPGDPGSGRCDCGAAKRGKK